MSKNTDSPTQSTKQGTAIPPRAEATGLPGPTTVKLAQRCGSTEREAL